MKIRLNGVYISKYFLHFTTPQAKVLTYILEMRYIQLKHMV